MRPLRAAAQPWCCSPPGPRSPTPSGSELWLARAHCCPWLSLQVLVVWDESSNKVRNYRIFEKVSRLAPLGTRQGGDSA